MTSSIHNIRGVALIQVLLISAIISLLAIQFSYTARDQVEMTISLENRVKAQLKFHSVQAQLLFALIETEQTLFIEMPAYFDTFNTLSAHTEEITFEEGIKIQLRDSSSMLSFRFMEHPLWIPYLEALGYQEDEAQTIINDLKDLQDLDRTNAIGLAEPVVNSEGLPYPNRPFQNDKESHLYTKAYPKLNAQVGKTVSYFGHYRTNMRYMDNVLKTAAFGEEVTAYLDEAERNGDFKVLDLINLPFYQAHPDFFRYIQSPFRIVDIEVQVEDVLWQESIHVILQPLSKPPFVLIGRQ